MRFTDFLPKRSSTAFMISTLNCSRVAMSVSCSTGFVPSVVSTMSRSSANSVFDRRSAPYASSSPSGSSSQAALLEQLVTLYAGEREAAYQVRPVFIDLAYKQIEHWIRFGREVREQVLDRRRRVLSFPPDAAFALVRWAANEHGTVLSRLDVLRAVDGHPVVRLASLIGVADWASVYDTLQPVGDPAGTIPASSWTWSRPSGPTTR